MSKKKEEDEKVRRQLAEEQERKKREQDARLKAAQRQAQTQTQTAQQIAEQAAKDEEAKKQQPFVQPPFGKKEKEKSELTSTDPLRKLTEKELIDLFGADKVSKFTSTKDGFSFHFNNKQIEVKGNSIFLDDLSKDTFEAAARTAKACGSTGINLERLAKQLPDDDKKNGILFDAYKTAKAEGLNVSGLDEKMVQDFEGKMKASAAPTLQPPGGRG